MRQLLTLFYHLNEKAHLTFIDYPVQP
jgi:hypothetical protein